MKFLVGLGTRWAQRLGPSKRITHTVAANLFQQGSIACIHFVGVPLMLRGLGTEQYALYTLLSAIPPLLLFADMGVGIASSNQLVMAMARGRRRLAALQAGSMAAFTAAVVCLVALASVLAVLLGLSRLWGSTTSLADPSNLIFLCVLLLALQMHAAGLVGHFLRALNKNAQGVCLLAFLRLAVFSVLWTVTTVSHSLLASVSAALLFQTICIVALFAWYRWQHAKELPLHVNRLSLRLIRQAFAPGLSYALLPMGNKLLLNGGTVAVNQFWGAEATVLFVATRTLANLLRQVNTLVVSAAWPELTQAFANRNSSRLRAVFAGAMRASFWSSLVLFTLSLLFAHWLFESWLPVDAPFNWAFYTLMAGSSFFNALWTTAAVLPSAINQLGRIGKGSFVATVGTLLVTCFLGIWRPDLLYLLGLTHLLLEIGLLVWVYPFATRLLANTALMFSMGSRKPSVSVVPYAAPPNPFTTSSTTRG